MIRSVSFETGPCLGLAALVKAVFSLLLLSLVLPLLLEDRVDLAMVGQLGFGVLGGVVGLFLLLGATGTLGRAEETLRALAEF